MKTRLPRLLFVCQCIVGVVPLYSSAQNICSPVGNWGDDYGYRYLIKADRSGTVENVSCGGPWSLSVSGTSPFVAVATNASPSSTCTASFTMTMRFTDTTCNVATGTWTNSSGSSGSDTWTRESILAIVSPKAPASYVTNVPVAFHARGLPGNPINWALSLTYSTSGSRGPFLKTLSFDTTHNASVSKSFAGAGGQLTAKASQNGAQQQEIVAIAGHALTEAEITAQLVSIYSTGATPRLLTGIAQQESSYLQFKTRTLYGISALWPQESFDGGSHIGLMQMPVSMEMAWDWKANTQGAAALFNQKLSFARRYEGIIQRAHTGLGALSNVQLENMALVFYGPYAHRDSDKQYYAAACAGGTVDPTGKLCVGGHWEWIVNTAGNNSGVDYADSVRSKIRQ